MTMRLIPAAAAVAALVLAGCSSAHHPQARAASDRCV
jgi:hypothetical protein